MARRPAATSGKAGAGTRVADRRRGRPGTPFGEATLKPAKADPCPRLMVTMPGSAFVQQLGVRRARMRPRRLSVRALDALLDERIQAVGYPRCSAPGWQS